MFEQLDCEHKLTGSTRIWRYCSIVKFLAMLDQSSLFFAPVATMDDPYEATLPRKTAEAFQDELAKAYPMLPQAMQETWDRQRNGLLASCWHINEHKSAALWNIYARDGNGVAIMSTISNLQRCLKDKLDTVEVKLRCVKYADYANLQKQQANLFILGALKRKSFEHEQELRALIRLPIQGIGGKAEQAIPSGLSVQINLSTLVECIYLPPTSQEWQRATLEAVIKKYGYNWSVIKSDLYDKPVW